MIQPYFKPDVNPNMPSFAVFYNGFYKERSAMNMQMMKLALEQASPEYLGKMIDRTQSNIEDLRKLKADIMKSEASSASRMATAHARDTLAIERINVGLEMDETNRIIDLRTEDSSSGKTASIKQYDNTLLIAKSKLKKSITAPPKSKGKEYIDWLKDSKLKTTEIAVLLEDGQIPKGERSIVIAETDFKLSEGSDIKVDETKPYLAVIESQFPGVLDSKESKKTTKAEEFGLELTPKERKRASQYIFDSDGIPSPKDDIPPEDQDIVDKEIGYRIATKKHRVSSSRAKTSSADFQDELDKIDAEITSEAAKLQGLFTRYGIQQQQGIDKIFDPFESNYRTENLFTRKTPRVERVEQQMSDYQYRDMSETPEGYSNIKYNEEYQAPGGLYFGLTKVGDKDTPYIFEGGAPYEISTGDPSYTTIIELLKEQDKKLGG